MINDHMRVHAALMRDDHRSAVHLCRSLLAEDPEDAEAHALLSLALLQAKRPTVAEREAHIALSLEPTNLRAHHALILCLIGKRAFADADQALSTLKDLAPELPGAWRLEGMLRRLQGRHRDAYSAFAEAQRLSPEDAEYIAAKGSCALQLGREAEARALAQESMALDPECADAQLLMADLHLRDGDDESAHELVTSVLRRQPNNKAAMAALVAIKTRRNPILGLWWRINTWIVRGESSRVIGVLVGLYMLVRLLTQVLQDLEMPELASLLNLAWLGFVIYSWVGSAFFARSLAKELRPVHLRDNF